MFKLIASAAAILFAISVLPPELQARARRKIPAGPVQFIELGHRTVEPGVPVVLRLDANAFFNLQNSLNGVAQFLSREPGSVLTPDSSAVLKLEGPDHKVQTIRLSSPELHLLATPASGATYRYHIEWRDRFARWLLRFPAVENSFTIQVARHSPR